MKREQMAKTQYKAVAFAAVLALLLLPIAGCATGLRPTDGLFSWHSAAISSEEARQALFSAAAACGAGTIYQGVDESGEAFSAFCDQAKAKGLSTYLLVGQPKWALDASGERQQAAVSWAAELGADGIVFDIEPYLLAEWDTGREELAQSWVSGLIAAKTAAKQRGVSMIVCVPYYLEDKIDGALYERLVRYGCDGLAVMNYYKKNEVEHLAYEAALCRRFGKALIPIYELQPPGRHGLQPINTYYGEEEELLEKSREAIRSAYGRQALSFAWHEYEAIRERYGE